MFLKKDKILRFQLVKCEYFLFCYSSMTVHLMYLGCGLNETSEDVFLRTFFTVFWRSIHQKSNRLLKKRLQSKNQSALHIIYSWSCVICNICFLSVSHRSTTWWCCLPTGPTWRTPAGCRSTRTSSRRRSRSFMTSTPLAPRSDSTPTHKDQREAWPCHSGLSPCLSLSSVFLSVSIYHPLPRGGGWRLGPSPLLMSLVRHMTMWSVGGGWGRHTNLLSHKQHFRWKKSPFTSLMDGVLIIIMTFILFLINSFSADSSFSVVCRVRSSRSISAFIFYFYFE